MEKKAAGNDVDWGVRTKGRRFPSPSTVRPSRGSTLRSVGGAAHAVVEPITLTRNGRPATKLDIARRRRREIINGYFAELLHLLPNRVEDTTRKRSTAHLALKLDKKTILERGIQMIRDLTESIEMVAQNNARLQIRSNRTNRGSNFTPPSSLPLVLPSSSHLSASPLPPVLFPGLSTPPSSLEFSPFSKEKTTLIGTHGECRTDNTHPSSAFSLVGSATRTLPPLPPLPPFPSLPPIPPLSCGVLIPPESSRLPGRPTPLEPAHFPTAPCNPR